MKEKKKDLVAPAIPLPSENKLEYPFITTPSNRIADNLSRANETLGLTTEVGEGKTLLEYNDLTLLATSEILAMLKPATSKALDILGSRLAPSSGGVATISVTDYMALRGIKDRKQAKQELKEAGRLAAETRITYDSARLSKKELKEYKKRGIEAFGGAISLASRYCLTTEGEFSLSFSPEYTKLALSYPPMLYYKKAAQLNDLRNPASYYIYRKITELVNLQRVRAARSKAPFSPSVRISIAALLASAGGAIPTEEAVARGNRQYTARITKPLERDLDALAAAGIVNWEYCKSAEEGGGGISKADAAGLPFSEWKRLLVSFSFIGYAEEVTRRETAAIALKEGDSGK